MEFSPQEPQTWMRGSQIAALYEQSLTVARQLPRYSVSHVAAKGTHEQPAADFGLWPLATNPRFSNRFRRDIATLAALTMPEVRIATNAPPLDEVSGYIDYDMPPMQDAVWMRLQEHWELARDLELPFRFLTSYFIGPWRSEPHSLWPTAPLLLTHAETAFTNIEEKILLYEWVHDRGLKDDYAVSALADSVPEFNFELGDSPNPTQLKLKAYDCTPDGWAAQQAELEMWNARYPDGPPPIERGPWFIE